MKSENDRLKDKLEEIAQLLESKAKIEDRLKILTGIRTEEKATAGTKPDGFRLTVEIRKVVEEAGKPLTAREITDALNKKFDGLNQIVRNVRATADYLVGRTLAKDSETKTFTIK